MIRETNKLSKTEKIIGITGKGTLILRKLSDIALANRENTSIYLPKNYTGRSYSKPLWNIKHGYMYYKNDTNLKNLKILSIIINSINKKYNNVLNEQYCKKELTNKGMVNIQYLPLLNPGNKNTIIEIPENTAIGITMYSILTLYFTSVEKCLKTVQITPIKTSM